MQIPVSSISTASISAAVVAIQPSPTSRAMRFEGSVPRFAAFRARLIGGSHLGGVAACFSRTSGASIRLHRQEQRPQDAGRTCEIRSDGKRIVFAKRISRKAIARRKVR